MNQRVLRICLIFSSCILLPSTILSIFSIYIGYENRETTCDNEKDDIIRLSTWLFINSGVSLSVLISYIVILSLFYWKEQYLFLILAIFAYIFNWIFVIVWNIIGAIELFKNAPQCRSEAPALWIIALMSVVFQWVSMLHICWIRRWDCASLITNLDPNSDEDRERVPFV